MALAQNSKINFRQAKAKKKYEKKSSKNSNNSAIAFCSAKKFRRFFCATDSKKHLLSFLFSDLVLFRPPGLYFSLIFLCSLQEAKRRKFNNSCSIFYLRRSRQVLRRMVRVVVVVVVVGGPV